MPIYYLLVSAWMLFIQSGGNAAALGDILSPGEKAQMEKADTIERRIKVYDAASRRIAQELEAAVVKDDSPAVPQILHTWSSLLSKSLEDIEANLKSKKKSRALINYEIQLRKSISRSESLKIRASADLQDAFDSCLEQAEKIRKRFVEILFRP